MREALRRGLPVLGICRGHQLLNVALGGTLIQDIPTGVTGDVPHDSRRERNRVIEGIELPDRPFVIGVQWHPESFWREEPGFAALFEALVHAARHARPSRGRRR